MPIALVRIADHLFKRFGEEMALEILCHSDRDNLIEKYANEK